MNRVDYCFARCMPEEAYRQYPYNDANGKRVSCLSMDPPGNLTWLYGVNLENAGSMGLARVVLAYLIREKDTALQPYAWYTALDEPRGSVFLDMAYNDGVNGLLHWVDTIRYATLKMWPSCASAMMQSHAAIKDPRRYKPLSEIILTGVP